MDASTVLLLALLMMAGAALYTSVGHAGASAYLAIMALFSLPAETMRPTALILNILVASFTTWRFVRAGQFNARLLLPFVNPLFHSSMLARRETLEAADAYARPNTAEDYVLWFDALRQGARIHKLAVPVVAYRLSPGQLSGAPDYHERIAQDPEVLRAWSAWARSGRMSWLVDNGGVPGRPVGTPEQLRRVVAGVRPGTRPYARRNLAQVADLAGHPAC